MQQQKENKEDVALSDISPLETAERDKILQTLKAASWNQSKTAQLLGIDRKTLRLKIRRYGLLGEKPFPGVENLHPKLKTRKICFTGKMIDYLLCDSQRTLIIFEYRQVKNNRSSLTQRTFYLHFTTVSFNNVADNSQTQSAQAAVLSCAKEWFACFFDHIGLTFPCLYH